MAITVTHIASDLTVLRYWHHIYGGSVYHKGGGSIFQCEILVPGYVFLCDKWTLGAYFTGSIFNMTTVSCYWVNGERHTKLIKSDPRFSNLDNLYQFLEMVCHEVEVLLRQIYKAHIRYYKVICTI